MNHAPRTIRILPDVVQNKIAAGEVVERPASVVKELAENAIDAGATRISIEMEEGGQRLIRVADDGCGMDESNLLRAIERHATSKIEDVEDIFRIATMGFRGEALPSIGAVSRLRITTCPHGAEEGHELFVEGGRIDRVAPASPKPGTIVEVRDLFFNTPARRKFMKSPGAEVAAAHETITRLALAHPAVAFRVDQGGRRSMEVPAHDSLAERIVSLFGRDLTRRLIPVSHTGADGAVRIEGYCAAPPESRPNSRGIYILLNKRWIRHPGLMRMVVDAYRGSLPPRRYPFAVLRLTVDTSSVDVNVHPAKEEVRFENESMVVGLTRRAVEGALRERLGAHLPGASGGGEMPPGHTQAGASSTHSRHEDATRGTSNEPGTRHAGAPSSAQPSGAGSHPVPTGHGTAHHAPAHAASAHARQSENHPTHAASDAEGVSGTPPASATPAQRPASDAADDPARRQSFPDENATRMPRDSEPGAQTHPPRGPAPSASGGVGDDPADGAQATSSPTQGQLGVEAARFRLLGQVGGRYLVIEDAEGMLLVDPHALHERWNYERLLARENAIVSQRMLIPCEVHLTAIETARADEALPFLRGCGFEADLDGATLLVRAHPDFVRPGGIDRFIRDVLADLDEAGERVRDLRETLAASMACRASVLFGQRLAEESCLAVLETFHQSDQPTTCPHGRPTFIRMDWNELAQRFGR